MLIEDGNRIVRINFSTLKTYLKDYMPAYYSYLSKIMSPTQFYSFTNNRDYYYTNWISKQLLPNYYQGVILSSDSTQACYKVTPDNTLLSWVKLSLSTTTLSSYVNPFSSLSFNVDNHFTTDAASTTINLDLTKMNQVTSCVD